MADYTQNPQRPNINPTPMPPSPPRPVPVDSGWGLTPVLGAIAVVGIVALVAWGVMDNQSPGDVTITTPAATDTTQTAPDPVTATSPDVAVTPEVVTPAPDLTPEVTPQEVPEPAPEVAPVPTPTPAPTN